MVKTTQRIGLGLGIALTVASSALAQEPAAVLLPDVTASSPTDPDMGIPVPLLQMDIDSSIFYEDFRDGFDGWTIERQETDTADYWKYTTDTELGAIVGGFLRDFESETEDNGFAYFTYLAAVTDSARQDFPDGPPYPQLTQTLVSPYIDLTDVTTTSSIFFTQTLRVLNIREQSVGLSLPDGTVASINVGGGAAGSSNEYLETNTFVRIPDEFLGQDSVQLRFTYDGDFYGWAVDDIYISQLPNVELAINPTFIAGAPSAITPSTQAEGQTLYFVTDVTQSGADTVGARLGVSILLVENDTTETLVYTDTLDYGRVFLDSLFENQVFPEGYPLPTEPGLYRYLYNIVDDSEFDDANPGNNSSSFFFRISDDGYYAKGFQGATGLFSFTSDAVQAEQRLGALFLTPNNPADDPVMIDSVLVEFGLRGLADDSDLTTVEVITYGWRGDLDGDNVPSLGLAGDTDAELEQIGINFLEFEGGTADTNNVFVVTPNETPGAVMLDPSAGFIGFAVEMHYVESSVPGETSNRFSWGVDRQFDYGGRQVASSAFDTIRNATVYSILGRNGDEGSNYDNLSRALNIAAFLQVEPDTNASGVSTLPEAAFEILPNPAVTEIYVDFGEASPTGDARIDVTNALGQSVASYRDVDPALGRITLDVTGLNAGLYYFTVTAADGRARTERILVQR